MLPEYLRQQAAVLMLFPKAIAGGVLFATVAWILRLITYYWTLRRAMSVGNAKPELFAVAGGWQYLLNEKTTIVLLAISFGLGVWAVAGQSAEPQGGAAIGSVEPRP